MIQRKTFTQNYAKDGDLNRVQRAITDVINPVLLTPILDGNLISNLTVPSTGIVTVPHGLGRQYLGYFVVRANDYGFSLCDILSDQNTPTVNVVLRFDGFSTGMTFSLWVF